METHGWDEENYQKTGEERGIDLHTYLTRLHQVNTQGLPVRLSVAPITSNWQRLLMIDVHPLPGFTHLRSWARQVVAFHTGWHYHISLCFVHELPHNGTAAYERIRQRYDGMRGVLSVHITNSAACLTRDSPLSQMILDDADVAELHSSGRYSNRELHVSL